MTDAEPKLTVVRRDRPEDLGRVIVSTEGANHEGLLTPEQLLSKQLVQKVSKELSAFFGYLGKDFVPEPPELLFRTMKRLEEMGIDTFRPYYLPGVRFDKNSAYPGWLIKPNEWLWDQMKAGALIPPDVTTMNGWVLYDTLAVIDTEKSSQRDPLSQFSPTGSRFGLNYHEITTDVLPAIARSLGLNPHDVILPNCIEANFFENLGSGIFYSTQYKSWYQGAEIPLQQHVYGGISQKPNSLKFHEYRSASKYERVPNIAFHPMIHFTSTLLGGNQ